MVAVHGGPIRADLGSPEVRAGLVLRVRIFGRSSKSPGRHYLALDDGRSAVVRAFRIRPGLSDSLGVEYQEASVTVTRQLRFVEDVLPV